MRNAILTGLDSTLARQFSRVASVGYDGRLGSTTDLLTTHAVDFISRHRDRPFFLYVPHLAVHFPWQGPDDPPHRRAGTDYHDDKWGIVPNRSNVRPHLQAMITRLDTSVGNMVAALDKHGLTKNTLVIFTSRRLEAAGRKSRFALRYRADGAWLILNHVSF